VEDVNVWNNIGDSLDRGEVITAEEFDELKAKNGIQIVDLRGISEYKSGHIERAENVFVGTLRENLDKIKKEKPTVVYCQSGDRTSIGYSLLKKHGYKNVLNFSGGINEWTNKGKPIVN
jgi:hydroxyacylglutathione hydrolase